MAQILERIFAVGGNTKLMSLNNGEYVRKFQMENDWNYIRIGLLVACPTNGTTGNRTMNWGLGLCSNMIGLSSAVTPHWVGSYAVGSSLTYSANSGFPYYTFQPQFARKVVTTVTTSNIGTINFIFPTTDGNLQRKAPIFLDMSRSYSVTNVTLPGAAMSLDYSMRDMLEAMEVYPGTTPSAQGQNFTFGSANSLSGDDSAGDLNTLSIYWGSQLFPLEIYGMAVYRFR